MRKISLKALYRPLLAPTSHVKGTVSQRLQTRQCSCSAPAPLRVQTLHDSSAASKRTNSTTSPCSAPPDHRVIATAQELLITSPYSPGSPLFLPNGARIFNKLAEFLRSQYTLYGYQEVVTPTIYKRSLWETSGHWDNYKEDMFEVSGRGASGVKDEGMQEGEEEEYGLKPMNCPGHCLMFKATSGARSLRDMPVRYADFSPLHRNENSGSLSGLTRVRRFHQDDAHIFCRPSQIAQEISSTLQFIDTVYKVFHLPGFKLVLSTRPTDCYIGTLEEWNRAEEALQQALNASGQEWTINEGDGAFYGPKIDIMLQDSDGKQHQTATIQLDFQLPRRFGLEYLAPAPESEQRGVISTDPEELKTSGMVTPVIIHRAILGSFERFMALLIEHYDGKWPFWISPRQAIVIPVATTDKILDYARAAQRKISGVMGDNSGPQPISRSTFVVDIDESNNSLSKKIRAARTKRYNYVIVVGEKNVEANTVSLDGVNMVWRGGQDGGKDGEDQKGQQIGGRMKKEKPIEMTVEEVYDHFLKLENKYA
ncbi:threonyl-tRNA synthetase [Rhizina undulata]